MIAKLTGHLDSAAADHAVIDVGGVGYLVSASVRTLAALPAAGEPATLHIETHVREDAIQLFGFSTEEERGWFRLLQSVQGVGARVALAILSALTAEELQAAIAGQDKAMVGRASGVGPKLAGRIVNELKDKAGPAIGGAPAVSLATGSGGGLAADAEAALTALGFRPHAAAKFVRETVDELGPEMKVEEIVRAALKKAAR